MTAWVILDADFLSAFLKIGRLPLVREFYQVEQLIVPAAVYREVAVTPLLPLLLDIPKERICISSTATPTSDYPPSGR